MPVEFNLPDASDIKQINNDTHYAHTPMFPIMGSVVLTWDSKGSKVEYEFDDETPCKQVGKTEADEKGPQLHTKDEVEEMEEAGKMFPLQEEITEFLKKHSGFFQNQESKDSDVPVLQDVMNLGTIDPETGDINFGPEVSNPNCGA